MTATGAKLPTLGASASEGNWSDNDWVNPTNIYSDDGNYASVTHATFDSGDQTYVLKATGFDFSSIPDGATILGVVCKINAYNDSTETGSIDLCQLLDITKAKVGTNHCSTPVPLTTDTAAIYTEGAVDDLWGNVLTPAWVKNANFGVALGIIATSSDADVYIDYVTLDITYSYTPPAGGLRWGSMSGGATDLSGGSRG